MRILPNQRNMALTETCAHRNLCHTEKIFQQVSLFLIVNHKESESVIKGSFCLSQAQFGLVYHVQDFFLVRMIPISSYFLCYVFVISEKKINFSELQRIFFLFFFESFEFVGKKCGRKREKYDESGREKPYETSGPYSLLIGWRKSAWAEDFGRTK